MGVKETGGKLFLGSGTLTLVLKRLETLGYMQHIGDKPTNDNHVSLTAPGRDHRSVPGGRQRNIGLRVTRQLAQ